MFIPRRRVSAAQYKFRRKERQYVRGINPCSNCDSGAHKVCRPKLDGTLCSCACPASRNLTSEVNTMRELAAERGEPIPSTEECVQVLRPKYRQMFSTPSALPSS